MMSVGLLPAAARREQRLLSLKPGRTLRFVPSLMILLVWQALSAALGSPRLPTPTAVLSALLDETLNGPLLHHLGITLLRVAICFTLAMLAGSILGIAMGSSERLNRWLDPWLQLFLTIPAMVVAILAYVWLGLGRSNTGCWHLEGR